jgi:hypothetical protein
MYYLLPTTQKVEKITEFVFESIPKFISIIWGNIGWIWGLPFMNLNRNDVFHDKETNKLKPEWNLNLTRISKDKQ